MVNEVERRRRTRCRPMTMRQGDVSCKRSTANQKYWEEDDGDGEGEEEDDGDGTIDMKSEGGCWEKKRIRTTGKTERESAQGGRELFMRK